jgi:hypothetical protein
MARDRVRDEISALQNDPDSEPISFDRLSFSSIFKTNTKRRTL